MKWPRQLAAEIVALPTREERRAALAEVPEHLREWVALYVTRAWHEGRVRADRQRTEPGQ